MRRRGALAVTAVALALALALALAVALFHDVFYRWLALRLVAGIAGVRVEVTGEFNVVHGVPLTVEAHGIVIEGTRTDPAVAGVADLTLRLRVGALLRGLVHVEELAVRGADVDLPVAALAPDRESRPSSAFKLPVFERVVIEDVDLRLRGAASERARHVTIERIEAGVRDDGLIRTEGRGSIDGDEVRLEGAFGSLDSLLAQDTPFPVRFVVEVPAWRLEARANGSVQRPLDGKGLRLEIAAQVADVRQLLVLNLPDMPAGHALEARALLTGDIEAPALSDLQLRLRDADTEVLELAGRIGDARTLTDLDLEARVAADGALLVSAFGDSFPQLERVEAQMRVRGGPQAYEVDGVELSFAGAGGLGGRVDGRAVVATTGGKANALRAADLRLELDAPLAAVGDLVPGWLGKKGKLAARGTLRGQDQTFELGGIDASLSDTGTLTARLRGRIPIDAAALDRLAGAHATLEAVLDTLSRSAALELRLAAPTLATLAPLTGELAVEPGPWVLDSRLRGDGARLIAEDIKLSAGAEGGARAVATGALGDVRAFLGGGASKLDSLRARVTVMAPSTTALGEVVGMGGFPDLGRVDASASIDGVDGGAIRDLSLNVAHDAGPQIALTGIVDSLASGPRLNGRITVKASNTGDALARIGIDAPRLGALDAHGALGVEGSSGHFVGTVKLGATTFDADLRLDVGGARPRLAGSLAAELVELADIGLAAVDDTTETPEPEERPKELFSLSEDPIPLDWLAAADLDLELRAATVHGVRITAQSFESRIRLDDRKLEVDPLRVAYEGGKIDAALGIDARAPAPVFTVRGQGTDLSVGAVFDQFTREPLGLEGQVTLDIELRGVGRSPHAIVSTLDGTYGHVVENGKLPGTDLDILGLRATQLLLSTLVAKDHTTIDCQILQARAEQGRVTTDAMYLATPQIIASGTGTANLAERTLDAVLRTKTKRARLFRQSPTVRIHGAMSAPEIDTNLSGTAAGVAIEAAGLVALPPITLPLAGLATLKELVLEDQKSPCTAEIARAESAAPAGGE
jgi:hypothetical protein